VPELPVKYWVHPLGAARLLLHSTCVTLIVKAEVEAVEALPMLALRTLHWSLAGMYICCPVLVPQITGGAFPPGVVTVKESVSQLPILLADPSAAVAGPTVMSEAVTGLLSANVSKSSRSWQTSELHLQIVRLQELPVLMELLEKYVQFSAMDPPPQVFSKMQQTPNPLAQPPLLEPPLEEHSELV